MASLESKPYLKNVFVGKSHFLSTWPNSEGDFVPVLYAINTKVGVSFLTCTICLFLSYLQHNFSKIRHEKAVNLFWHHYGVVKPVTALWFYLDSALWKNILMSAEAYLGYDDTLKWKGYPANIYLFKISNKNTRTTSLTSYWCFCC